MRPLPTTEGAGVLLMAYGAPASLDDVERYLLDVRDGRATSPELVAAVRHRYAAIGGRSPLLDVTRAQARAVARHLAAAGLGGLRVEVGMRHAEPSIADAVGRLAAAGCRRLVALCLAPQYSRMSVGAYFARLDAALAGTEMRVARVAQWHDHPLLLQALAARLAEVLEAVPRRERDATEVLFTAHSLPARLTAEGDPYARQVEDTARGVAALAAVRRWRLCYQSAGARPEPWLGPMLLPTLDEVAAASPGARVVVAPVGFVADNVEILFDLDVEALAYAAERGLRLLRPASLDDSPLLAEALARLVIEALHGLPAGAATPESVPA